MAFTFILNDDSVLNDRGSRVITNGILLERFTKNPVMLYMHVRTGDGWNDTTDYKYPIGHWENVRIEGTKLLADAVFDENDKESLLIKNKVENGHLRGASCGLNPIEFSEDLSLLLYGQTRATISKCELIEASIVDIPANPNTIKLYLLNNSTDIPNLKILKMETKKKRTIAEIILAKLGATPDEIKRQQELFKTTNDENILLKATAKTSDTEITKLKADLQTAQTTIASQKLELDAIKQTDGAKTIPLTSETDPLIKPANEGAVYNENFSFEENFDNVKNAYLPKK